MQDRAGDCRHASGGYPRPPGGWVLKSTCRGLPVRVLVRIGQAHIGRLNTACMDKHKARPSAEAASYLSPGAG